MNIQEFIQALPKAELHLHIEGSIPWELTRAHANGALPEIPEWALPDHRFDDFLDFEAALQPGVHGVLASEENYYRVAGIVFENLVRQNVRYVEISFGAGIPPKQGLRCADVVAAIKRAAPEGLTVRVYGGFHRRDLCTVDDDLVTELFDIPDLDGIDLHGDERARNAAPFAEIFAYARERGLRTRAHAGELLGPVSIIEALDVLQVERIEHGTTAMHDEALIARLAAERITLDLCPMSNVKLRVVDSLAMHPIRRFMQQGIPVTVSTDDPAVFGCTLTDELHLLVDHLDMTRRELAELQRNAFQVADMPAAQRESILAEIDDLLSAQG